jgi:hypothetical protein
MTGSEDEKLTEQVKVLFGEAMLADLQRQALEQDRGVSELVRHICALYLYGHSRTLRRSAYNSRDRES